MPKSPATITAAALAEQLGGELQGNGNHIITGVADLKSALPEEVSFLGDRRYLEQARKTKAGVVLVTKEAPDDLTFTRIVVENPSAAFGQAVALFAPPAVTYEPGVHARAVVDSTVTFGEGVTVEAGAVIEKDVTIGANSVIGAGVFVGEGTSIGEGCLIHPGVCIRERTQIGNRVIIHCNTVVGSDGFGYELVEGRHRKIPQVGIVRIDDDVEIGANVAIDRARFSRTWIQQGAKIDNLVQIAHNVVIGEHSLVVSQAGISGSTRLGKYVTLAGQAGVAGHLEIGDQAILAAQGGLLKNMPPKALYAGYPARDLKEQRKLEAAQRRVPDLLTRVKELEKRLASLENSDRS